MLKNDSVLVVRLPYQMLVQLQDNADFREQSLSEYIRAIVKPSMYRHSASRRCGRVSICNTRNAVLPLEY